MDKMFNVNNENENELENQAIIVENQKKMKKFFITFLLCILMFLLFFSSDYLPILYTDGNVLRLPQSTSVKSDTVYVGDPWKNSSLSGQLLFRNLFSTDSSLTEVNPDLCSEYEVLNDGLTYVITLKDNLKWSDGVSLTVDDIIFSIETFLKCTDVNPSIDIAFSNIKGVDSFIKGNTDHISGISVNGNKITFNLENQHNSFMLMLTQFPPLPKHILENEDVDTLTGGHNFFTNGNSISNGMYMSKGLDSDSNLVFTLNPHYEGVKPKISEVIFYWDYQNMEMDLHQTSDYTQIVSYRAMRGYQEYLVDVLFYRYFVFNIEGGDNPPNLVMQDERIRQAISHAIDTETLLKDVYDNAGKLIHSGSPNIANELVYEYNPIKARELLKQADYDFDRPISIIYYYRDATSVVFLLKVAQYLEAIGLKVDLISSQNNDDFYKNCDYDILLKGLSSFDTKDWYYEYLSTNANMGKLFGTKEFDVLVQELDTASSEYEINNIIKSLVELEQELLYKMPLFTLNQAVYVNTNRLEVPDNMVFGNTRYSNDLRFDEWKIKHKF